jgi:hypothetical protein
MCEPRYNTKDYQGCGHSYSWVNQHKSVFCSNAKVTTDEQNNRIKVPCDQTVFSVYLKTQILDGSCGNCQSK